MEIQRKQMHLEGLLNAVALGNLQAWFFVCETSFDQNVGCKVHFVETSWMAYSIKLNLELGSRMPRKKGLPALEACEEGEYWTPRCPADIERM